MSERAECKRIEGKYWELIKVWPLECRQVQAMVAEEDDDVVVVGRWRMAGSSRYQFYDTIPAYVLVLKYTDSKSGGS